MKPAERNQQASPEASAKPPEPENPVDEAIDESFPASDPPSYSGHTPPDKGEEESRKK